MARFWCIIWVCTCNFSISIWSSPNATYKATANKYFWNQLAPQIMHQNLAVMLRQFCYSKISFIVFVPGPIPSAPPSYEEAMKIGNSPIHDFPPPYSPTAPPVPDSDDPRSTSIWRSLWPSRCSQSSTMQPVKIQKQAAISNQFNNHFKTHFQDVSNPNSGSDVILWEIN